MNFFDQCDEIINEVKFSAKRHAKVSDLLASLASKKVGSTFKLLKGEIFGEMKFVKSDGITGVGNVYVNNNGQYLRIGLADKKKLKDLNSFDFWEQGPITNNPTRSAIAFSHYNIIDTVNIVLEYILTGKELEESLREDKEREWLQFPPGVAPIDVAIFPLIKKDNLPKLAKEILLINLSSYDSTPKVLTKSFLVILFSLLNIIILFQRF